MFKNIFIEMLSTVNLYYYNKQRLNFVMQLENLRCVLKGYLDGTLWISTSKGIGQNFYLYIIWKGEVSQAWWYFGHNS